MATGFLKISEMTLATGMNATDYFPVIQAGDNKRMTFSTALAGYSVTGHDHSGVYDTSGSATGAVATHELNYDHTSYITGFTESDPIFTAVSGNFAALDHLHSGVYSVTGHTHTEYITGFTETDPVFAAASGNFSASDHLHTGVYSTTGHDHSQYITGFSETDPIFSAASGLFSVTGHEHAQYITGFTETDPVFGAVSGSFSLTGHTHTEYITGFTETDPVFAAASGSFSVTGHDHAGTYVEDVTITADTVFPIDYLYKTVSGVQSLVTEIPKSNGVVAGGLVTWDTGLTFLVSPCAYYIEGTLYSTESSSVTLPDADPSNPRIDIIIVDSSEQVTYVTGIAAASPAKPQADPVTQIELTQVQINAGATGPDFTSIDEIIFDENTEWTGSVSGPTASWETTGAFHGSKCAEISTIGNSDNITFTGGSSYDITDYETLIFYIKLKMVMSAKQNIYVSFWNSTQQICTEYLLPINKSTLAWQNISIPISSITFSTSTFNILKFRWSMTGPQSDHLGFYLDFIKLHSGAVQPVYTDTDNYVNGVTWDSGTRTLTLQRTGTLADLTVVIPAESSTGISEAKVIAYSIALG